MLQKQRPDGDLFVYLLIHNFQKENPQKHSYCLNLGLIFANIIKSGMAPTEAKQFQFRFHFHLQELAT